MAYESESVWAIDIGNNSLKALNLTAANGIIQVLGFDNIRHGKILAGSGISAAERDELIAISLRQLAEKYDLYSSDVIISVPSQNSFARFVTLPPVEKKKIPEIVKFEAVQQIPFDINEVQWSYQMMSEDDEPEKRVGIFAIKNEIVNAAMEPFESEEIAVSYVQMAPMAIYNYILHDRPELLTSDNRALVLLNIGAENTDLVVCTRSSVWQRCILIGGNAFTRAIADTFKLNFQKAEKLKRTAPVSKYARQIFQAMRPVFTDLAGEVQRSLGFYTSSNPNVKLSRVIAMGGGTRLRGLLKYLQQTLQVPVSRPDSFKRISMAPGVPTAKFTENVADFGIVYGLGVQALGYGHVNSNLLPTSIARSIAWAGKARWLTIAASIMLLASVAALGRTILDGVLYRGKEPMRREISSVITQANEASQNLQREEARGAESQAKIDKQMEPFKYRKTILEVQDMLLSTLPNARNNPSQAALYKAFQAGDVETVMKTPRPERKQIFLTTMAVFYADDLEKAQFGTTALQRMGSMGQTDITGEGDESIGLEDDTYGMMGLMEDNPYAPGAGAPGQTQEAKKSGFVVTLAGYSPYKDIGMLLHPDNVANDPTRWGIVNRLLHLDDEVPDGNSPFAVFSVTDNTQFKLDTGAVDLDAQMPVGIGVVEEKPLSATGGVGQFQRIVLDPMTREIIGKTPELDATGAQVLDRRTGKVVMQEHDHWFVLNIKLIWRDGPNAAAAGAATTTAAPSTMGTSPAGRPAPSRTAPARTPPARPNTKKLPDDF